MGKFAKRVVLSRCVGLISVRCRLGVQEDEVYGVVMVSIIVRKV